MRPDVEKAIQKYLNSPDGDIKRIYPVIDRIDFNHRKHQPDIDVYDGKIAYHDGNYVTMDLYLNTPPMEEPPSIDDLWSLYNLDEHYLMDYHMPRIYRLFGLDNFSYMTNVYIPNTEGGYHNMREINNRGNIVTEK
jgi:hypothetical protein|tara:strand:+ start:695 stop:1102 length:408 start_codon:yes stop_codon:yes gene_type:complete